MFGFRLTAQSLMIPSLATYRKVIKNLFPDKLFGVFRKTINATNKTIDLILTSSKSLVASLIHWNGFASGAVICNEIVLDNFKPPQKSVQKLEFLKGRRLWS